MKTLFRVHCACLTPDSGTVGPAFYSNSSSASVIILLLAMEEENFSFLNAFSGCIGNLSLPSLQQPWGGTRAAANDMGLQRRVNHRATWF